MTLEQQSELYIKKITEQKRNPASLNTLTGYRSYLRRWILPELGHLDLADVNNKTVKVLIGKLNDSLSPVTVTTIKGLIARIVASAINEDGEELYPRKWNLEFMDVPVVKPGDRKAPILAREALQKAISGPIDPWKALYIILAASGLRKGELMALQSNSPDAPGNYYNPETGVITVRAEFVRNQYQPHPKTAAGNREIDLHPEVSAYLKAASLPTSGWLFPGTEEGQPVSQSTVDWHLKKDGIGTGCHSFRRFRLTHLELQNVPRGLCKFWMGHGADDVTDLYMRIGRDIQTRKDWAIKAGIGFSL